MDLLVRFSHENRQDRACPVCSKQRQLFEVIGNGDAVLFIILDSAGMQVGGDAVESGLKAEVVSLSVDLTDVVEVLIESLGQCINFIFGKGIEANEHALNCNGYQLVVEVVLVVIGSKYGVEGILLGRMSRCS